MSTGVSRWLALCAVLLAAGCNRPPRHVTYHDHVAPILLNNCATCHRPGQTGPFPLLTYEDARKRAAQIAEVTSKRYMPPWLPEHGEFAFEGDRSLKQDEIDLIARWAQQGAPEGPGRIHEMPQWTDDWHQGKPDLIATMPEPYHLAADGPDVYRNFVLQLPLSSNRYVRAVELRPGSKAVHHAFMRIDKARAGRRLDAKDPEPGFPGMHTPGAEAPDGFFLTWQPGKVPPAPREGMTWTLEKNSDLVLQAHMQPSGKPELIQCAVGLYFSERQGSLLPANIGIRSLTIEIPPGVSNHVVEQSYILPADVELLGILPHAHYLGRQMRGAATLPDGTEKVLLSIRDWDFNWQGEYQYKRPVKLPKGTRVSMRYVYDNSTNNVRNPNQPPRHVSYGIQSADEMAELWLQVLAATPEDRRAIAADQQKIIFTEAIEYNNYLLRLNPSDARAHGDIGKNLMFLGRKDEAAQYLARATELDPSLDEPHYYRGLMLRMAGQLQGAREAFAAAVRANPENSKAHGNLGLVHLQLGDAARGKEHLEIALRLNPGDEIARQTLNELQGTPPR